MWVNRSGLQVRSAYVLVAGTVLVGAVVLLSSSGSALANLSRPCPAASFVNRVLGQHGTTPVRKVDKGQVTCTYPGTGDPRFGPDTRTAVTFESSTPAEFARIEHVAMTYSTGVVKVKGLGQAAWRTNATLYVLAGQEQISVSAGALAIRAPTVVVGRIEALARALIAASL